MSNLTFQVDGMTCAACVGRVEKALDGLPFVTKSSVNLAGEKALFQASIAANGVVAAQVLARAGYPVVEDQIELQFEALPDAGAVAQIERAVAGLLGVLEVNLNLTSERARIRFAAGAIAPSDILATISETGYSAEPITGARLDMDARKTAAQRDLGRHTLLSAVLTAPVFVAEMGGHLVPAFHHILHDTIGLGRLHLVEFLLTAVILMWPGRRFFTKGLPQLFRAAPDMNSLVAVGTLAAFSYSTLAVFVPQFFPQGTANVYFESAAVIITLILFGRWMEARAKGRTGAAIRALTKLTPATATVQRDGEPLEVLLNEVVKGDVILVRPGTAIPVDAVVLEGTSFVNEAMITGEPAAVRKTPGDEVIGGTVNGEGVLRASVARVGTDTMLAQIIRLVDQAQGDKLPIQSLVDKITAIFVPVVMGIGVLTSVAWLLLGPPPALPFAMVAGVAVLIIACPCAMGLATPTSIMVGTGRAAQLGVLFRQGAALQTLANTKVIAFDKTGTLTKGAPELAEFVVLADRDEDEILAMVASVEAQSEHPIAHAICAAASARALTLPVAANTRAVAGFGIKSEVNGAAILIGAKRMMAREKLSLGPLETVADDFANAGKTPVFVAVEGTICAVFAVVDPLKPNAKAAIEHLHSLGLRTVMLTGDTQATARVIGDALGIDDVRAELLPRAKIKAVEALKAEYGVAAFVGDGINDAPALAGADVGIAIGTGTDVAIGAADVVLVSGDISGVVSAFRLSQATLRNIRQNLFWAFAYNVVLIPVAAGVFYPVFGVMLSPMLGAFAMAMSSIFVLTNALRLRFVAA